DACSTQTQFYSTTGKMPVPHKLNFIQQQARCLFHTNSILFNNRQDACSTQTQFYCGTGKMPVPHKLNFIQQQARCLFHTNSILLWNGPKSPFLNRFKF
ncbi:hypothetical protein, partial [Microcoleus sp. SVA1_A1]|uniref:hypothetical protein n=1 Tax=Microcoleus sp. SVA1_A1 TaxID=2818946 RepID=UPI002FCFB239